MTNEIKETKTTTFTAPEIVCGGCAGSIKKALGSLEGVSNVEVDVETKKVTVNHDQSVSPEKIAESMDHAGFSVAA
jgi:copper chaperone